MLYKSRFSANAPPLPNEEWPPLRGPFSFGNGEGLNLTSRAAAQVRVEGGEAARHNYGAKRRRQSCPRYHLYIQMILLALALQGLAGEQPYTFPRK